MLHDITFGRMENEFHDQMPREEDLVICIRGKQILMCLEQQVSLKFPTVSQGLAWADREQWTTWSQERLRYVFRMQDRNFFLWMGDAGACPEPLFQYVEARSFRQVCTKDQGFANMTAWHLYNWYRVNRFCGCCGGKTVHDAKERMLRCKNCGNMIFPRISPAVIVAVTDGDRLLMSKYTGRAYTHYALIAGYTEIGETMEQTVRREVMEEVGLKVNNIRYYKSQPWGVDGNVLMGFYCDLEGSDEIHLDETELALAQWFPRDRIPVKDEGFTLTHEMIRIFQEGREPKGV